MATERQKAAFNKILENPRSIGTVMREVGYSENTIVDPKNLTESKGWLELCEKYLPNKKLVEKHNQFLESEKEEIGLKALDMAYKLKGNYAPEKSVSVNVNVDTTMTEKEKALIEEFDEKLKQESLE